MSEKDFWFIIDQLDWVKDADNQVIQPAVILLASKSTEAIRAFQDILAKKLHQLDQRVFAEQIGKYAYKAGHFFSVDEFLYARACVIANGKVAFNHVLKKPEDMPKDVTFESLLEIAPKAFHLKTGNRFNHIPAFNYETFSNKEGWKQKAF